MPIGQGRIDEKNMTEPTINELASMKDILRLAIAREESSHEVYRLALKRARTHVEREMFTRLAEQELGHKEELTRQLDEIQAQIDCDRALSTEYQE